LLNILALCLPLLAAYLLGAVPFGLLVSRLYGISDVRAHGSGNIGATNVWRVVGSKAAIWVYVLDIGKGVAAVLMARSIDQTIIAYDLFLICCAMAAILGHVFPVYLRFKGGKGVNTVVGTMVTLLPVETAISIGIFLVVVSVTRYISLASLVGTTAFPAIILVERVWLAKPVADVYLYTALLVLLLVILTHRQNIRRLLAGTENRFSFSSRTGGGRSNG
jgi:glycerol-3-phosphate acyltransferase PlsY